MPSGWNYVWGESWHEYIQRSTETRDEERMHHASNKAMLGAISGQTASILTGMHGMGSQISSSMDRGFSDVSSSLNQLGSTMGRGLDQLGSSMNAGFDMLGGQMDMIGQEIAGLNASFQWGFGQMIAQMGGMNDSLKALIQIAKTPAQTAAYEQFEIARDAFRQELYEECLEALGKAINGDHTSPGYKLEWRFHKLQGVVQLGFYNCDMKQVNEANAEQAFLLSARYAKRDAPKEAAKAMLSAGWSAYVQGKLSEALEHTQQAVALDSDLTEAYFQVAKISMAAGNPDEALPVLRKAIDQSPGYILKAAADGDFKSHESDLNNFFEIMLQEAYKLLTPKVKAALEQAEAWAKTVREVGAEKEILDRWQNMLQGEWGLLDLLKYDRKGFREDQNKVTGAHAKGVERLKKAEREELNRKRNSWHLETKTVKVMRDFEESFPVEEEYQEEVVVKPKGWFSKEKTELVTMTRTVTKQRSVQREVEEETRILVNELGETILVNELGEIKDFPLEYFKFVHIPAGTFIMGSPESETGRSSDETQHEVTISKAFEMQTTPITQSLWEAIMGDNPSDFKGADCPVENVSWDDVQEFIKKLNKLFDTNVYRLPTEAEWEYACRAGTTTPFWTGDNLTTDQANYDGNYPYANNPEGEYRKKTTPVKMFKANPWGLYDMHGNVYEWCQDWSAAYASGPVTDPTGSSSGSYCVGRGGHWNHYAQRCRSVLRFSYSPGYRGYSIGVRLSMSSP